MHVSKSFEVLNKLYTLLAGIPVSFLSEYEIVFMDFSEWDACQKVKRMQSRECLHFNVLIFSCIHFTEVGLSVNLGLNIP